MTDPPAVRFVTVPALGQAPGYSHLAEIRGGRTVFISGQIALDAGGNLVGSGDFPTQSRQVFRTLGHALGAAELDFTAVVKLTAFLTDMAHFPGFRAGRDGFVTLSAPPATSTRPVAGLVRPELPVEVEAIAAAPRAEPGGMLC